MIIFYNLFFPQNTLSFILQQKQIIALIILVKFPFNIYFGTLAQGDKIKSIDVQEEMKFYSMLEL